MRAAALLVLLLTACSPGCGAPADEFVASTGLDPTASDQPPVNDPSSDATLQREAPAVIHVELGDAKAAVFRDALDWFSEQTGLAMPEIVIGECPSRETACVYVSDDPNPGSNGELATAYPSKWTIAAKTELLELPGAPFEGRLLFPTVEKVFRHEVGHWFMWPHPGVDGLGHSDTGTLMNAQSGGILCPGFSQSELDVVCMNWACNNPIAECE